MAKSTTPKLTVDLARARAFWWRRQGLAEPAHADSGEALARVIAGTGWLRTLGGVDGYLAAKARVRGLRLDAMTRAIDSGWLRVTPAVRGCIYLVPRDMTALCLRVAEDEARARSERDLVKAGSSLAEAEAVQHAAIEALKGGPLGTDELRDAIPKGVIRSLGPLGKKVGLSSPLPVALRLLEFDGRVERVSPQGRLDTLRYAWRLPAKSPYEGAGVPEARLDRVARLAELWFGQAGPSTFESFVEWSGVGKREAQAALERLPLAAVAIEGYTDAALVLEDDVPALVEASQDADGVALLAFEDNLLVFPGRVAPLVDAQHHHRPIAPWGPSKATTLGDARHVAQRTLLVGGRLAGYWELDPDAEDVVTTTFDPLTAAQAERVRAVGRETAAFLLGEVGHACSFSLDTMDQVRERAAVIRAAASASGPSRM